MKLLEKCSELYRPVAKVSSDCRHVMLCCVVLWCVAREPSQSSEVSWKIIWLYLFYVLMLRCDDLRLDQCLLVYVYGEMFDFYLLNHYILWIHVSWMNNWMKIAWMDGWMNKAAQAFDRCNGYQINHIFNCCNTQVPSSDIIMSLCGSIP